MSSQSNIPSQTTSINPCKTCHFLSGPENPQVPVETQSLMPCKHLVERIWSILPQVSVSSRIWRRHLKFRWNAFESNRISEKWTWRRTTIGDPGRGTSWSLNHCKKSFAIALDVEVPIEGVHENQGIGAWGRQALDEIQNMRCLRLYRRVPTLDSQEWGNRPTDLYWICGPYLYAADSLMARSVHIRRRRRILYRWLSKKCRWYLEGKFGVLWEPPHQLRWQAGHNVR